jgi:hemolysin activation/secretion protein
VAGSNAVRGFRERLVARDRGVFAQFEAYTPELAGQFKLADGRSLRLVTFFDAGYGANTLLAGDRPLGQALSSAGAGIRASIGKNTLVRLDLANTLQRPEGTVDRWRAHLLVTTRF